MLSFEQKGSHAKYIAILVFLFPVAGIGIRHWFSGIAALLVFSGIYIIISKLRSKSSPFIDYSKSEKILILLVASLFLSYLLSGFVNGWNENQTDYFFGEMNFLFFVPLYMAVRYVRNGAELIIKGTVFAGIFLITSYIYDLHLSPIPYTKNFGAYGHLLSGPVSVIIMFLVISSYKYFFNNKLWKILFIVSSIFSFITTVVSKAGTGYALLFLMCLVTPLIFARKWKNRLFIYIGMICILVFSYNFNGDVKHGVLRVTDSVQLILSLEDSSKHEGQLGSAGDRIAMWGVSWKIFKDNLLFGVGRGNYTDAAQEYYNKGEVHAEVARHSHPHNIYFELLASKGLVGISVFLLLIFVILRIYIRAWNTRLFLNEAALVHIFAILLVGLGSEGPILKNNFTWIFLVYTAVFYSSFSNELKNITIQNSSKQS